MTEPSEQKQCRFYMMRILQYKLETASTLMMFLQGLWLIQ